MSRLPDIMSEEKLVSLKTRLKTVSVALSSTCTVLRSEFQTADAKRRKPLKYLLTFFFSSVINS